MIKNKIELENQIKDNINAHLSILNISDDILNVIKKIHQKLKVLIPVKVKYTSLNLSYIVTTKIKSFINTN